MRSAKEYKAIREEIYRFIGAYITKHVYAPSNKEIAEAVGISGTTVHRHLIDMIDEGILETDAEPGTQGTVQRLLQDEQTGQIYPVNNVFVSIINNAMVEEGKGEYTVTEPLFNPLRGILWKNNVCKLRAHFRTDDKNIKVLKSLKGVDITPEVPEE
jgi:SOS-response transcriptional repressor LexA